MELSTNNPLSADELYTTHYIKKYPDRLKLIQYKTPYKNKDEVNKKQKIVNLKILSEEEKLEKFDESLRRTKTTITDLVLCNQFDLFVTFTFNCRACVSKCKKNPCNCDKATCTRYDLDYVIRTQKNLVQQYH